MPPAAQNELARARALASQGDLQQALALYKRLAPQARAAGFWHEYGATASRARQPALAEEAWDKAAALEPTNAELLGLIGHQFEALRRPEKALAYYQRAAAVDPRGINPRISLAVLLEKANRLAEARAAVNACLAIDPRDEQAVFFAASLDRREGNLGQSECGLRDLIATGIRHPYVRYAARYELAQALDRMERYDEAMKLLGEAKEIVRGLTDTEALLRAYDQSAAGARAFTQAQPKDVLATWASYFPERKREAIPPLAFLGGHPRSGTTLLEQALDAHPEICALDESPVFLEALQPEFLKTKQHSSQRLNVLRRLYVESILAEAGPAAQGKMLLDKNPSPTARLPIWLRVFPELKVIIALRDPRDVVLSCYFQNIPLNTVNVNFLSLERVARHYADLMDIWLTVREWAGFQWIETRYEDVVAGLEKEVGRVTQFLGLTWQPEQARFHEQSREKQFYSPTYQDVTRPVYQRSVARWRRYEKHLDPVLPALAGYCRALGCQ